MPCVCPCGCSNSLARSLDQLASLAHLPDDKIGVKTNWPLFLSSYFLLETEGNGSGEGGRESVLAKGGIPPSPGGDSDGTNTNDPIGEKGEDACESWRHFVFSGCL